MQGQLVDLRSRFLDSVAVSAPVSRFVLSWIISVLPTALLPSHGQKIPAQSRRSVFSHIIIHFFAAFYFLFLFLCLSMLFSFFFHLLLRPKRVYWLFYVVLLIF